MGGLVTREKLVNETTGGPWNYFEIPGTPYCGSSFLAYKELLRYVRDQGVGLVVTLTVEPLKSGRNVNHYLPHLSDETEWIDADQDLMSSDEAKDLEFLHVPIDDGEAPTADAADLLLTKVRDYRRRHPEKKVLLHCWRGSGRTSSAVAYLMREIDGIEFEETRKRLSSCNRHYKMCPAQHAFASSSITNPAKGLPVVQTPGNHRCYEPTKR